MDQAEKTCIKCAAQGFFLAKYTNNNEEEFISGVSTSLRVYPDDVKKIFMDCKKRWTKKRTTKKKVKKK